MIEAHPIARLGVKHLLENQFVLEELADGRGAVELLTSLGRFDVAIVEMRGPGADGAPAGTTTIRSLLQAQPGLGVVARSGRAGQHSIREALDCGAAAFVRKDSAPTTLLDAVAAAGEQRSFIDPAIRAGRERVAVTRRQREVLQLFADGLSTPEIAARLGLSEETIRTHAKATLARLGARDRTHAVAIALRDSLID
jgi:DNA-binding NarL/FixJ family response regulator